MPDSSASERTYSRAKHAPIVALLLWLLCPALACAPQTPAALDLEFERQSREVVPGLTYAHLHSSGADALVPLSAHVMRVDLRRIEVEVSLAEDQVLGRETTRVMVQRRGAVAGINGGFFIVGDPASADLGDPNGFFVLDGSVVSDPVMPRASLGFCDGEAGVQQPVIVRPRVDTRLHVGGGEPLRISGRNRARDADDLIFYTPRWGPTTTAAAGGIEAAVESGRVIAVHEAGSTPIPADGYVLSASGPAVERLGARVQAGMEIDAEISVTSLDDPGAAVQLEHCSYTSAGPRIVRDGEPIEVYTLEEFRDSFTFQRHPRTAVGYTADRETLIVVVVDGRQPGLSGGMSLPELARLMLDEGAHHAYNLDGGGSSTMVVQDAVVNSPSDGRERPNSDGLVFFTRPAAPAGY